MDNILKNIDYTKAVNLGSLVQYQQGQVVSRTLAQGNTMNLTIFAFDKGEEISSHASKGDAMVYIIDGVAEITIGEEKFIVKNGEVIIMPANVPHALYAKEQFKMLLTVIFKLN